jgi:hypothetical protein
MCDERLRAEGLRLDGRQTFALAVFLTRPQAEHQIGAGGLIAQGSDVVTTPRRAAFVAA